MGQVHDSLCDAARDQKWTKLAKLLPSATKASFNYGWVGERNVLHLAIEYGAPLDLIAKILTYGIPKGLDLEAENIHRETALQSALRFNAGREVVNLLLDNGSQVENALRDALEYKDTKSGSWEYVAPFLGNPGAMLDENGGDVLKDTKSWYREFVAVVLEHPRSSELEFLLKLHYAIHMELSPDLISKNLKKQKIQVKALDTEGNSPLHVACGCINHPKENLEMVKFLLAHGADVHALKQPENWTALHVAADAGASLDVVQLLLENGADPKVNDANGRTALQLATKSKESHLIQILGGSN